MKIVLRDNCFQEAADVLKKHILERIPAEFVKKNAPDAEAYIELNIDPSMGPECYEIKTNEKDLQFSIESMEIWIPRYQIIGGDYLGLLYGVGKFLHTAVWTETEFYHLLGNDAIEKSRLPKIPAGVQKPDCPFRASYFSVHAYNWYQQASADELISYMEELLLYGYNTFLLIVPVMNIQEIGDPVFQSTIANVKRVMRIAKSFHLSTGLFVNPNQGLLSAPEELNADPSYEHPTKIVRGNLGRNLCPNKPGAVEYLTSIWSAIFNEFTGMDMDYMVSWPYDEGGCGCEKCRPWGGNGFADITKTIFAAFRKAAPNAKLIVSTWLFDRAGENTEYADLYKRLETDLKDAAYLMVDDHKDFPAYPLEHPVKKPIVNFPEISMWGLFPWGGYGANPLPKRFERIFRQAKDVLSGGAPYSEGLFEDISKVQEIGYYWNKNTSYTKTLAEYVSYEFGVVDRDNDLTPEYIDDALEIMEGIEINHVRIAEKQMPDKDVYKKAAKLARKLSAELLPSRASSWRFRILYIRAVLDEMRYDDLWARAPQDGEEIREARRRGGIYLKENAEAQKLFSELRQIYHSAPFSRENYFTLPPANGECIIGQEVFQ